MPAYFSKVMYEGGSGNFIEIAIPTGTDTSAYSVAAYTGDGDLRVTFQLGTVQSTTSCFDIYVIDSSNPGFYDLSSNNGFALVDNTGTVLQFLEFDKAITAKEGPAAGQTSSALGDGTASTQSAETTDGGASYQAQSTPNPGTIPCYAPGTMIDTPDGLRPVETLQVGDLVITLDHGPQAIRWTHSGDHPLEGAGDEAKPVQAKPVQVKAGSLGRNLPAQDLIVSPQHRILVGWAEQLQKVFDRAAFAPAKPLTSVPGIRHMRGKARITWIHFACDRHEVVTANGCLSESLLLGPMVVNGLSPGARRALADIFGPAPTPDAALNGPPARDCLTVDAVKRQLASHLKDKGHTLSTEIRKWDRDLAMEQREAELMREAASSDHPPQEATSPRLFQAWFSATTGSSRAAARAGK